MPAGYEPASLPVADPAIRLVPFEPGHLLRLDMGSWDRAVLGGFDLVRCAAAWPAGPALTAMAPDRVLGCGGLVAQGRDATAWAVLSEELRRRRFVLHRAARRFLDGWAPRFGRLRTTVVDDFAAGHRWARALGFGPTRVLPAYGPNGETFMEYER